MAFAGFGKPGSEQARIVQFSEEGKTLPDGSKIIYAENDEKIVLYHRLPFDKGKTYVYDRQSRTIYVNGKEGSNQDKRRMIELGTYMLENSNDYDLVTLNVYTKGEKKGEKI